MPAGLGFLPSGEAVVTDMHGRSLVRCVGGQPVVHADLSALSGMSMPQLSKCPAQATHESQ